MAKKKLKDLLDAALGLNEDASIEDALAVISKEEDQKKINEINVNGSSENAPEIKGPSINASGVSSLDKPKELSKVAYNVELDAVTKKFKLITVSYTSTETVIKEEIFAASLPEVNYKLGTLIIEKLIRSK